MIDNLNKNIHYFILTNNLNEWRRLQNLFFSKNIFWIYNKEKYFDGYPDHGKNIEFTYPKWMSISYLNIIKDEYDWVMTTDAYEYDKKNYQPEERKLLKYNNLMRKEKLKKLQNINY